jgi:hypothetical protein
MINEKINIDKYDTNTAIHAMHGHTSTVSYGINCLPYHQLMTQIPDGTGAGAVIWYHTTIDVRNGAQPYYAQELLLVSYNISA